MTDTTITLTPASTGFSGPQTVTASAALFDATFVGRTLSIYAQAPQRAPSTAYGVGAVFYSEYDQTDRVYRVLVAGATAAQSLSGTTPNYDQNAPRLANINLPDGSATLKYLGDGKSAWGFGVITAVLSPTQVTVDVDPRGPFANTTPSLRWRLGDWGPPPRGYPSAVTFHQERTVWAGSAIKPDTMWFSTSADFETFSPSEPDGTVLDTAAITIALDDDQVNDVVWMAGIPRGLAVGTGSGEWIVGPASTVNAALAPTNIRAVRQTDRGSADIAGIRISGVVLFVQRGGRKLRELQYDFATDSFTTQDLTELADHIADAQFLEAAYQEEQHGTLWLPRADGLLISLTFDREERVRAWAKHVLGGDYQGLGRPLVESVCCVPGPDGQEDDLYVSVVRTLNGQTVRTIEWIRQPYRADLDGPAGGYFVDCGLSYSGTPATVFSGLDHLDGQTVAICADGAVRPSQVVANGTITIAAPAASTVHVGLPYVSQLITLPPETPNGAVSQQAALKSVGDIYLRFLETRGGKVGRQTRFEALQMRPRNAPMSQAEPLFTGDYRTEFAPGVDRTASIWVLQDQPLPMTLLAIVEDISTNA